MAKCQSILLLALATVRSAFFDPIWPPPDDNDELHMIYMIFCSNANACFVRGCLTKKIVLAIRCLCGSRQAIHG